MMNNATTNNNSHEQLIANFDATVALAEEAENPETSPFHVLVKTAGIHHKNRIEHELNIIYRQGFDEFSTYLDAMQRDFAKNKQLKLLQCLVDRIRGNYRSAMICYLNGLDQTAFDIMRDVMEITYLIRDFVLTPAHIEEWANGTDDIRRNKFGSGHLRRRFADHLGVEPADLMDTQEYKSHSRLLHVNPGQDPLLKRGICKDRQPQMSARYALADIFHHAIDVCFILHRLLSKIGTTSSCNPGNIGFLAAAHGLSRARFGQVLKLVEMAVETTKAEERQSKAPNCQ